MARRQKILSEKEKTKIKTYKNIMQNYPTLIKEMIDDLLLLETYSEIEISYAINISFDVIRKLASGDYQPINRKIFFKILTLYISVYGVWH